MNRDTIEQLLDGTGIIIAIVLMLCLLPILCVSCCFMTIERDFK